ncbi:hypothetical protein AUJ62_03225 [Candidatus Pacearchaeota archaeon CG1_02_32_21]|nr:MAG: hypothetical protein AUJ62_03225 [Candidatus Pacearchaeota archaeon CG1_02_32_21]
MNLKNIAYALAISSVLPIVSTGCETVIRLDDKVEKILDKNNDWTKEGVPYSQMDLYMYDKNE